jgi:hypothetical protein
MFCAIRIGGMSSVYGAGDCRQLQPQSFASDQWENSGNERIQLTTPVSARESDIFGRKDW